MRARIEGRYVGLPNLEVIFHSLLLDSLGKEIGTVLTDENGIAQLTIPSGTLYRDTSWQYEFMAEFKGNDLYGESDDAISIISAELNLEQEEEDSVKIAGITLHSKGEPIVDEYVELFVKTHFNPYRLGEASTDDHGRASIPIPDYLKSDAEGNIHVFARLDDHNDYGTLIANATIVWGLADHHNLSTDLPASLWSQDPPLWLLFTFLAILFTIWIHYIGTIYKLYKMKIDSKKLMEEETV